MEIVDQRGQALEGVVEVDEAWQIVYANPAFCSFVGLSSDAVVGQPLSVFFTAAFALCVADLSTRRHGRVGVCE